MCYISMSKFMLHKCMLNEKVCIVDCHIHFQKLYNLHLICQVIIVFYLFTYCRHFQHTSINAHFLFTSLSFLFHFQEHLVLNLINVWDSRSTALAPNPKPSFCVCLCNPNEGLMDGFVFFFLATLAAAAEEEGKSVCLTKHAGTNDLEIKPGHYIVRTCMWFLVVLNKKIFYHL